MLQRQSELNPGTTKHDWAQLETKIFFKDVSDLCDQLAYVKCQLFAKLQEFVSKYGLEILAYFSMEGLASENYETMYRLNLEIKKDSRFNLMIGLGSENPFWHHYDDFCLKQFTFQELQVLCQNETAFEECLFELEKSLLRSVYEMNMSISKN